MIFPYAIQIADAEWQLASLFAIPELAAVNRTSDDGLTPCQWEPIVLGNVVLMRAHVEAGEGDYTGLWIAQPMTLLALLQQAGGVIVGGPQTIDQTDQELWTRRAAAFIRAMQSGGVDADALAFVSPWVADAEAFYVANGGV
jgi:hypothetical protein